MAKKAKKPGKKRGRKILLITFLSLIALVVIVLGTILINLNTIAKTATEKVLTSVLKVPVTVGKMSIAPLRGSIEIRDLVIGNPEGFHTDSAMSFGRIFVRANIKSFTSEEIVIHEITMEDSDITWERSLTRSNIDAILKNIEKEPEEEEEEEGEEKEPEEETAQKKVVIDVLTVDKAKIRVATTYIKGQALGVPLPKIEMKDIGRESETSVVDVIREFFMEILGAVTDTAGDAIKKDMGNTLQDTGRTVGDSLEDGAETVGDGLKGIGDSIGNLFGGKEKDENKE